MKQSTRPARDVPPQQTRLWFPPLTGFRQVGTHRHEDETTTYLYALVVSKELSPIKITLTITPDLTLHVSARFDESLRRTMREGETA